MIMLSFEFICVLQIHSSLNYIMPTVRKLCDGFRVSFSAPGPVSEAALAKVCAILGAVLIKSFESFVFSL